MVGGGPRGQCQQLAEPADMNKTLRAIANKTTNFMYQWIATLEGYRSFSKRTIAGTNQPAHLQPLSTQEFGGRRGMLCLWMGGSVREAASQRHASSQLLK